MPHSNTLAQRPPVYYIGHAGVPLLFGEDETIVIARENLRAIGEEILSLEPRPKAIIAFSGHFEAGEIHGPGTIEVNVKEQTHIQHDFVGDFHDTHPHVYKYEWDHQDAPKLGSEIWRYLKENGLKAKRVERGVDHGVWVPFKVMFPPERPLDIPLIQVSTFHGYDLESQIKLGEVFESLREEGYLILGSGMAVHSFSSIEEIKNAPTKDERVLVKKKVLQETRNFDNFIREAVVENDPAARKKALLALESRYEFKRSHPTVEHFTPLLVAAGAAGEARVEPLGVDIISPGMSFLNVRFS
ncbi:unnamed protein product [Clonostachys byssicola]|uniref:Extradiol ring-cleavage dioxygenase class III enzyme subunit B domain-containing protein n=1 Tax=Clonostachys byssicola TaxID=160290 RepID=A0A9N9UUH5_9HYPO|nr:unnamed protein product [Clonostachys byssicola]